MQTIGNCLRQFFRKYCSFLFFPSFLAKIDDAHERHLLLIYTLCQDHESILAGRGVVITLERRRGASENNSAFLDLRAHHCDVARVISWRFLLFIGCLVFFIDHDEPEIFERRKNRAARADHDACSARVNFVPFIVAFAFRQMTVEDGDRIRHVGKATLETLHRLRRQRNFRD